MVTIVAHVKIKPDRVGEFEAIERQLSTDTKRHETGCLLYECWRGEEENRYYVLMAFKDEAAFYQHQVSEWHEKHAETLYQCFEDLWLEFVDPLDGAGSRLRSTERQEPLAETSAIDSAIDFAIEKYREEFPVVVQPWWRERRRYR